MTMKTYRFSLTIERTLTYDDEDREMLRDYGDVDDVESMVDIDLAYAKEDPVMFFVECGDNWGEPVVEEVKV